MGHRIERYCGGLESRRGCTSGPDHLVGKEPPDVRVLRCVAQRDFELVARVLRRRLTGCAHTPADAAGDRPGHRQGGGQDEEADGPEDSALDAFGDPIRRSGHAAQHDAAGSMRANAGIARLESDEGTRLRRDHADGPNGRPLGQRRQMECGSTADLGVDWRRRDGVGLSGGLEAESPRGMRFAFAPGIPLRRIRPGG